MRRNPLFWLVLFLPLFCHSASPSVTASASPSVIWVGENVSFSANAVDDGSIVKYEWDFEGDGVFDWAGAASGSVSHYYGLFGNYSARVRVTDNEGLTAEAVVPVRVNATPGGVVRLEYVGVASSTSGSDNNFPIRTCTQGSRIFMAFPVNVGNPAFGKTVVAMSPDNPGESWPTVVVDENTTLDGNHDGSTIICDGEGYVHVWPGVHNAPWKYYRSVLPGTVAGGFEDRSAELASKTIGGNQVTYPRAWSDPAGRVYLTFRDRNSTGLAWYAGVGVSGLGIYDPATRQWTIRDMFNEPPPVSSRTGLPYGVGKQNLAIGPDGRIHTAIVWSDWVWGTEFGFNLTYAYSDDLGATWRRTDGSAYSSLPIRLRSGNPDIVLTQERGVSVLGAGFENISAPIGMMVDSGNWLHLFFMWYDDKGQGDGKGGTNRSKWGAWHFALMPNGTWLNPDKHDWGFGLTGGAIGPDGSVLGENGYGALFLRQYQHDYSTARVVARYWSFPDNFLSASYVRLDQEAYSRLGKPRFMLVNSTNYQVWFVETRGVVNTSPTAFNRNLPARGGVPLNVTLTGYDSDGDALSYSVVQQPSHGSLSGTAPKLAYTPSAGFSGEDFLTFKISDGIADSAVARVSFSVAAAPAAQNSPPVLSAIGGKDVVAGDVLSFSASSSDADGDSLSYSATNLPSSAVFSSSGAFSWIPSASDAGTYSVTFSVSDGRGGVDGEVVAITVVPAASPSATPSPSAAAPSPSAEPTVEPSPGASQSSSPSPTPPSLAGRISSGIETAADELQAPGAGRSGVSNSRAAKPKLVSGESGSPANLAAALLAFVATVGVVFFLSNRFGKPPEAGARPPDGVR